MKLNIFQIWIIKFFISIVVFFILILLFLRSYEKNEEIEYETNYSQKEILYNTWISEDFDNIDVIDTTFDTNIWTDEIKKQELKITSSSNIIFHYNPLSLKNYLHQSGKIENISELLFSKLLKKNDLALSIELNNFSSNIRARYSHNTIKIFNIAHLSEEEFLSVFIHELGHYFDIKQLEKQVFFDLSDNFYDISWSETKILHTGSDKKDFVSGYAMSNKYEDFAESFTYYILYNNDFREKMRQSKNLEKKYDFFSQYIFRNDEFKKTNFRSEEKLADYYWDTTKISFLVKNFLEYLKNWI